MHPQGPGDRKADPEAGHLDDKDTYREVLSLLTGPKAAWGEGRDLGLCCSLLYTSAWNSARQRVQSINVQE